MSMRDRLSLALPRWQAVDIWLILAAAFICLLTFFSVNKFVGSDPKLTLLVSQSIIENGTIRLDAYKNDQLIDFPFSDYVDRFGLIVEQDGHYRAYFPAGPSVIALPFVWAYHLIGKDMRTYDNFELQIFLSALSAMLVFLLLFQMGTYLVSRKASLIISFIAVAGSSLSSTIGSALWTLNFSTLFITLVLILLVRDLSGKPANPYLLGLLLFLCYFVRPSTAVFILPVLIYLFWQRRSLFWPTAITALLLLLLFLAWSRYEYGHWLPSYYSLTRLQVSRPPMWIGILGNLISPSRGIFVFSPFFLLLIGGVVLYWRELTHQPIFWLCITWLVLQLIILSRAVIWWGGVSFGPRLLTDALPGMVLLLFLCWQQAAQHGSAAQQSAAAALFLVLGAVAIAIHITGQYRPATNQWNMLVSPLPTAASDSLNDYFDWSIPQFLATQESNCQIEYEKGLVYLETAPALAPYFIDRKHDLGSDQVLTLNGVIHALQEAAIATPTAVPARATPAGPLDNQAFLPTTISRAVDASLIIGWDDPFASSPQRDSICSQSAVVLLLVNQPLAQESYWLNVTAEAAGSQSVIIGLNESLIGEVSWSETPELRSLKFPAHLLKPGDFNVITFRFPDSQITPPRLNYYRLEFDDRPHTLSLHDLTISSDPVPAPTQSPYP